MSFVSTFLIVDSLLLQNIFTYPFSSYVSESALQFSSWFSQLTEPSRDFLSLNLYGWPCNVLFFALPNLKLLHGGVPTWVNRLNMASSISDVGALKSCVLLDILAIWGFQHSSTVTAFIAIFQIHFSCYDEKREKMTLQFLHKIIMIIIIIIYWQK